MIFNKRKWTLVLAALMPCTCLLAQTMPGGYYKKEMTSLQQAIQNNFYDKASGNYFITVDSAKREIHKGYLRKYTYLWSLCALYQAANEMEKLDPGSDLMSPLVTLMNTYYSPALPKPGFADYIRKLQPGERYYDDNEWIGITALDAYARKKENNDLTLGQAMYDFVMTGYDQVLGGGIYWKEGSLSSKNTCSNGPGILVALQLYEATKNNAYLDTALQIFSWTNRWLQTPSGLYYDNIRVKDSSISKPVLSYNTGTMLEANVYLYEITGDKKYLINANAIAGASLTFFYGSGKFRDNYWFNAVLLRAYQHLLKDNPDTRYIIAFKKCLDNALQNDRNEKGLFQGKDGEKNLVDHGGMLEILARYAWLETRYRL